MPLTSTLAAIGLAAAGNASMLAASAATPSEVAPWVQGGGSAAAVAGLVYVARMIVKGDLVPRPVKEVENELAASIMAAGQREATVLKIAEQQAFSAREQQEQREKNLLLLARVERGLEEVATEMRYWREARQRRGGGDERRGTP